MYHSYRFSDPYLLKVYNRPLEDKPFELIEDIYFYSFVIGETITVPMGYRTDFASVPKMFWCIIPPYGRYGKASIIHDWLIDNRTVMSIHLINEIFLEAMDELEVSKFYKYTMYGAVKLYWDVIYPIKLFFTRKKRR